MAEFARLSLSTRSIDQHLVYPVIREVDERLARHQVIGVRSSSTEGPRVNFHESRGLVCGVSKAKGFGFM